MCGRRRAIGIVIFSFAVGALMAAALPLWVLAIFEAVLLIILGWVIFNGN